jgi:RHS repeat-associated protein
VEHGPEGLEAVPYRFTGKELDEETGLYYYGARYLNPRTSRWISPDPGLETYLPVPPVDDEARKHNRNLPGQGGVFNYVNLAAYYYAGNNPMKYADPSGLILEDVPETLRQEQAEEGITLGESEFTIRECGCTLTSYTRIAMAISGENITLERANEKAIKLGLYNERGELTTAAGAKLIAALTGRDIGYRRIEGTASEIIDVLQMYDASKKSYYATGRIWTQNEAGTKQYGHHVNIVEGAAEITLGGLSFTINSPQPIVDTSGTGRTLTGWSAGRPNRLLRADVFYVIEPAPNRPRPR